MLKDTTRVEEGFEMKEIRCRTTVIATILLSLWILVGCNGKAENYVCITLEMDQMTPSDEAIKKAEISEYLIANGLDGYIKSDLEENIQIDFIEGNETLEALDIVLGRVYLEAVGRAGIIVYKDDEVIGFLEGVIGEGLYIMDMNQVGNNEILYESEYGSGMRYMMLSAIDLKNNQIYVTSVYNENDGVEFGVTSEGIAAYSYYYEFDRTSEEPIGLLKLTEEGIQVEGLASLNSPKIKN